MRKIFSGFHPQRGQVMVLFSAMFAIITVVGFLVVDTGLWFAERRGAQTDADLPALAGARECMLQLQTGQPQDPYPAIQEWFSENNPGSADITLEPATSKACFDPATGGACNLGSGSGLCCVDVIVKHKSKNLFSALPFFNHAFDTVAGNIGAHARACAGAAQSPTGILPSYPANQCFQDFQPGNPGPPDLQNLCWLAGGAHDKDCGVSGNRCWLDLAPAAPNCSPGDGHKSVVDMFGDQSLAANCSIDSHPATCDAVEGTDGWSDCVTLTSGNSSHIEDDVYNRVHTAPCDKDADGIDDLSEVMDLATGDATICSDGQTSPRLISVPVIDKPGEGTCSSGEPCPIIAFAAFYIAGCFDDRISSDDLSKIESGETPLSAHQIKCDGKGDANIPQGHQAVLGKWIKVILPGSGITPANNSTTEFSIALCDWETDVAHGGCGSPGGQPGATSTPTNTPTGPTATATHGPTPTRTPVPPTATRTPMPPTRTPTPRPTATPTRPPTNTPVPTPTPTPRCAPGCRWTGNHCTC